MPKRASILVSRFIRGGAMLRLLAEIQGVMLP